MILSSPDHWNCSPRVSVALGALLALNLLFLVINLVLFCSRRSRHYIVNSEEGYERRALNNFQTFLTEHAACSSSVVLHTVTEESTAFTELPSVTRIPEEITCVEVLRRRKAFVGRVTWSGYEAIIKECINPMELQLHRKLKHDNIVEFYWSNMVDKPRIILSPGVQCNGQLPLSFYCMEFCHGRSLNTFLLETGHNMSVTEILHIILDVVSGLLFLHSHMIAHRDIKCENIMIQSCGKIVAKIADFDHAMEHSSVLHHSNERKYFGSPLYTSPEFLLEMVPSPWIENFLRHDVYSLSLLMWECMTWARCKYNTSIGNLPETTPLLPPPGSYHVQTRSLTRDVSHDLTNDVAQYRQVVKCSSIVHIALLSQVCKTLGLRYSKKERVLQGKGFFSRGCRLIDRTLMRELYTKNLHARPPPFPETSETAQDLNRLLENCWRSEPSARLTVAQIHQEVEKMLTRLQPNEE